MAHSAKHKNTDQVTPSNLKNWEVGRADKPRYNCKNTCAEAPWQNTFFHRSPTMIIKKNHKKKQCGSKQRSETHLVEPTLCYGTLGYQAGNHASPTHHRESRGSARSLIFTFFFTSDEDFQDLRSGFKDQSLLSARLLLTSVEKKLRLCWGPISMGAWFLWMISIWQKNKHSADIPGVWI